MPAIDKTLLNRDLMPANDCFGCGLENPDGMGIQLFDRDDGVEGLCGDFDAPEHALAFPKIIHPGALFTALVCLSVWTPYRLRQNYQKIWFLIDTELNFGKVALLANRHQLKSRFVEENGQSGSAVIAVSAEDPVGDVVAGGQFTVHPFSPAEAMQIAEIDELPESWKTLLNPTS